MASRSIWTNLIEVHIHAFKLKIGCSIVAGNMLMIEPRLFTRLKPYMPEPSRPCSPEICCLGICECLFLSAARRGEESGDTKKQRQFGCPFERVSQESHRG